MNSIENDSPRCLIASNDAIQPADRSTEEKLVETDDRDAFHQCEVSEAVPETPSAGTRPIEFQILRDGSLLDLVKISGPDPELQLLHSTNTGSEIARSIQVGGCTFNPPEISRSLLHAVRMPAGVMPSATAGYMLARICEFLGRFVDLPDEMLFRVTTFALASWFPEKLSVAPLLWITGPPASGKTTLLALLHCVCRRALLLTDVTPAALYSLPDTLKPTLLIDEGEFGSSRGDRRLIQLIRAGSTPGFAVPRNGRLFNLFCPKAVAARMWPDDDALASRAIFVTMLPLGCAMPAFNPELLKDEIDALQAELLDYRLRNFHAAKITQFSGAADLNPRTLQIAASLAVAFQNDRDLQQELVDNLQDDNVNAVRFDQPEYIVIEALLRLAHDQPATDLTVQHIAERVNQVFAEHADDRRFKARRVGAVLHSLGLKTERLGSWGRGIPASPGYLRQVHELARRFGLTRRHTADWQAVKIGYGGVECELCEECGLTAELRFVSRSPYTRRRRLITS